MQKTATAIRKIIVFIVGITILIIGVILIPLPGPGLLLCFLALLLLSLEFKWARPFKDKVQAQIDRITKEARDRIEKAKQD